MDKFVKKVHKTGPNSSLMDSLLDTPFYGYELSGSLFTVKEANDLMDRLDFSIKVVRPIAMRTQLFNIYTRAHKEVFSMNVPYGEWWDFDTNDRTKVKLEGEEYEHNYNATDIILPRILVNEFGDGLGEYNFDLSLIQYIEFSKLKKFKSRNLNYDGLIGKVAFTIDGYALFEKSYT
ncbi:hypothetical protein HY498_04705 [Candidatus Woesearchaeota archaeon]|nr:hypothetical protein [Candidatus Woesearchaeota archaeon]